MKSYNMNEMFSVQIEKYKRVVGSTLHSCKRPDMVDAPLSPVLPSISNPKHWTWSPYEPISCSNLDQSWHILDESAGLVMKIRFVDVAGKSLKIYEGFKG